MARVGLASLPEIRRGRFQRARAWAKALAEGAKRASTDPALKDFWLTLTLACLFAWMAEGWVR